MRIKEINIFTPSEDRGYLGCFLTLSDCMAEYPRPRRGYQFANLETRSIWVYDGVSWWNSNRQLEPMRVIGSPAQSGDIVSNEPSAYYYVDNSGLEQTLEFVFNNTTTGTNESITVRSSGYAMVYIWWTGKTLEYKKIDIPSDERMSGIVCGTIDIGSFQYDVLDNYNTQEQKGWYVIRTSQGFGGHMLVTGDDMGHVIHQFIFSDYVLDDSGTINSHRDDTPSVIVRTYNLRSSTIEETIPVGTWGKWWYLQDTFISQTFGNAANKTVSQKIISEAITAINNCLSNVNLLQLSVNIEPDSMGDGTFDTNSAYNKLVFRCEGYVDDISQCELRFMRRLKRKDAKAKKNTRHGWGVVRHGDGYESNIFYTHPLDTLERTVASCYAEELAMGKIETDYVRYRTGYSKGSKKDVYNDENYRIDINNYGMAVFQGDKMISNIAEFGITIINQYSKKEQRYIKTVCFTLGRGGAGHNIRNNIEFPI